MPIRDHKSEREDREIETWLAKEGIELEYENVMSPRPAIQPVFRDVPCPECTLRVPEITDVRELIGRAAS